MAWSTTAVADQSWASRRRWLRGVWLLAALLAGLTPAQATRLVVATVNNGQMIHLQDHAAQFERDNPDIQLQWVTLDEHALRDAVRADIKTRGAQFDVLTVGMYETPIWARRGWLKPIRPDKDYDIDDLLPAVRQGLSLDGELYAAPFYGESSMLMYRKDLMQRAGVTVPARPTWAQVAQWAARLHDPQRGVYGICLRGKPGWGENISLLTTMVNAHGGQWFDMRWQPQLHTKPWLDALTMYLGLLRQYGPPNAERLGFNDNLALFRQGHCAQWIDATVAAAFLADQRHSAVATQLGFAPAPTAVTAKGSHWLWSWALAIPAGIDPAREAAAQRFVLWATSRAYVRLIAQHDGWALVPSGTRTSTYANKRFRAAVPWADIELEAMQTAHPSDPTLPRSPYVGVQFVAIPEFQEIGNEVGQIVSDALRGNTSAAQALETAQRATERRMRLPSRPDG